jgi:glycerol-3-phosphate dehydrogenase (NAD(P)+)
MTQVAVLGNGSWGTAFSMVLADAGSDVVLWGRRPEAAEAINTAHENADYLPGIVLPESIVATADPVAALAQAEVVVLAVPSQTLRSNLTEWAPLLPDGCVLVSLMKGIELGTTRRMSEVVAEVTGASPHRVAVVSGPNLAKEIAQRQPAASVVACADEAVAEKLQQVCMTPYFRVYTNTDVVGVELGGAVKNVLAIAAGIVDGQGLGASAHAALVTRGFAEMRRLGKVLGARPETLIGLSGLGDLILTCGSPQSRNMSLGRALGRGETLPQALAGKLAVTEGVYTAAAVRRIADDKSIDMPICAAVCDIIDGRTRVKDAIGQLMQRPLKAED